MNRASTVVKHAKDLRWVVAAAVVIALMGGMLASTAAASTPSRSFVYVNNDSSANSVSAFAAAADGSLSAIPGSPFPTGGAGSGGGFFAARTESLVRTDGRLYVANKRSATVTGFSVDATTGALTPLPGSPYPTGLPGSGFSLDAAPLAGVVFAAGQSTVATLPIKADGSLGSPTFTPTTDLADGMEVSPDGQLLALALANVGRIHIFQVGPGGTLTPAPGSPMATGYPPTDVRFSPDGSRLFTGSIDPTIRSYAVAGNGALTAGPSVTASGSLQSIVLSPDGTMLFASDVPNRRAWGFTVAPDGSMAVAAGSPMGTSSGLPYTTGIGTDPSGGRLFVVSTCAFGSCDDEISAFSIGAGASLTPVPGNPFKTGARGFPTSVVVVGGGSVPADTTPPSITGNRDPAPNAQGWNNEAVTVSFICEDEVGGSGLASCSDPVTLSGEGAGQSVTGSATDNAENESTAVVGNINIDLTPPSLDGAPTSEPNVHGWYKDDVTVAWNCSDALSGIPGGCPDDTEIIGEGAGLSATASVTDRAGNTTVATVDGIDIDRTAPVVSFTGNAGTYAVDEQVDIACAASDALSGVASHTCAPITGPAYSFGVGDHTFGAAATDAAGNEESVSVSFTVRASFDSVCNLTKRFSTREGVARSLCAKLDAAAASAPRGGSAPQLRAYRNELAAQSGKTLALEQAELLSELSRAL